MHLEILTPEASVFEGEVTSATFPGADGTFQVLENHAPLVSLLKAGVVIYLKGQQAEQVAVTGGVVEVLQNKVVLLADGLDKSDA